MIKSMTGFGKSQAKGKFGTVLVEIRTLNHKFFEIAQRLPNNLLMFEDKIREYISKSIKRGRINLNITYERNGQPQEEIFVDALLARRYYKIISSLKRKLKLQDNLGINQLISFPGVITYKPKQEDYIKTWPYIKAALDRAISEVIAARKKEGGLLKKDLLGHAKVIEKSLRHIQHRLPSVIYEYRRNLLNKIKELSKGRLLNKERIEEEAALFAKNCDVSEELCRINAHLASFKDALNQNEEVGRKLDFIAQELYREINTVGAKAEDFRVSSEVINIKSHIEKIREQIQNIE